MRNTKSHREKRLFRRSASARSHLPAISSSSFIIFTSYGSGGFVVVRYLVVLLRSLQNQRHSLLRRSLHEPFERLLPNAPVPYENVTILVRSELALAVVEMEERRRLPCGFLEFVEHRRECLLRLR